MEPIVSSSSQSVIEEPMLLIPGVRKCGTTTLFSTLSKHSRIRTPVVKEPQFFALQPETVATHLDWYRELYSEREGFVLLDASTYCFAMPDAATVIAEHVALPKVVLLLRDPAKRAFSGYLHTVRRLRPRGERRSFEEILDGLENRQAGVSVVEQERLLINEAIRAGTVNPNDITASFHRDRLQAPFDTDYSDMMMGYRYFEESHYSRFVGSYEEAFGARLKIVFFEQLTREPERVLTDILTFAGLEPESGSLQLTFENRGRVPKSAGTRRVLEARKNNPFLRNLADWLKKTPLKKFGSDLRSRMWRSNPKISDESHRRTVALLSDETKYWVNRYPYLNELWSS